MPDYTMLQLKRIKQSNNSSAIDSNETLNHLTFVSPKLTDEKNVIMNQINLILAKYNLNKYEVKAYILLARSGAQKAITIAEHIEIERTEVYKVLKNLEGYGLIMKTLDKPMMFKAKPFEIVLEDLILEEKKRILQLEQQKTQILDVWSSLPKIGEVESTRSIQVLDGKRQILTKVDELLSNCEESYQVVVKDEELIWLYNSMFFENAGKLTQQKGLKLLLVTELSATSEYVVERVDCPMDFVFKKKGGDPSFILKDNKELIIIMNEAGKGPTAMFTNYNALTEAFKRLFEFIWSEPNVAEREPARKILTNNRYPSGTNRL